jgi:hypothetical protein
MKAEDHFQKATRIEEGQSQLDPGLYGELIIEGCYMAAHHYIEAGAEWLGVPHPQSHAHKDNIRLLRQAKAPQAVIDAWNDLDVLRPGGIYGKRPDLTAGPQARTDLKIVKDWVETTRPRP